MLRGLLVAVMLLVATPAFAVGPVVGASCTVSYVAPTTYTDGSAIAAPVTYKVYVAPGIVTTVGSPAVATATGLTVPDCTGLAAGQYTMFVTSVVGGLESPLSAPFNFSVVLPLIPNAPTGVLVR